MLPVVHGRREKDLIIWNAACALLRKLSHCTPLQRHNFSLSWTPDPALLWHLHFFRTFWIWWRSASTANKIPSYTWCVHSAPAHVIPKTLKVLRDPHAIIESSPGLHRIYPTHLWLRWSPSVPPWSLCDAPPAGVKSVSNQLAKSSLKYSSGKKGDLIGGCVCVGGHRIVPNMCIYQCF